MSSCITEYYLHLQIHLSIAISRSEILNPQKKQRCAISEYEKDVWGKKVEDC